MPLGYTDEDQHFANLSKSAEDPHSTSLIDNAAKMGKMTEEGHFVGKENPMHDLGRCRIAQCSRYLTIL